LTVIGGQHCNHKVVPLIRVALWFPRPHLLQTSEPVGVLLATVQFPLIACAFGLAIRRWRAGWVLAGLLAVDALDAGMVMATFGPPR